MLHQGALATHEAVDKTDPFNRPVRSIRFRSDQVFGHEDSR